MSDIRYRTCIEPMRLPDQSSSDQRIDSITILLGSPLPRGSWHPAPQRSQKAEKKTNIGGSAAPGACCRPGALRVGALLAKGKSEKPRASANSKCTTFKCVQALTALRDQEKELRQQQSPGVPHTEARSNIIPLDMAVVMITEILGERCCRPAEMAAKRRRCSLCECDRFFWTGIPLSRFL